jgi:hypothetical protein
MKKNTDHKGAIGICDTALGYAINARPGPKTFYIYTVANNNLARTK